MYINHQKAKRTFRILTTTETPDWIIISGGEDTGKKSFIKEVCPKSKTIFNNPDISLHYLEGFYPFIIEQAEECIKKFLENNSSYWGKIKEKYNLDYINDIEQDNYKSIIWQIMNIDMSEQIYRYALFLSKILSSQYNYVVLEDFYKCDASSYEWLLRFAESFLNKSGYIIALCDFEKNWKSNEILSIFRNIPSFINIATFSSAKDYYDVLKEKLFFDNIEYLFKLSKELFEIYRGNAQLLFRTVKMYNIDKYSCDDERKMRILQIADTLTMKAKLYSNKAEELVLASLALIAEPLSAREISNVLEITEDIIRDICFGLLDRDLLELRNNSATIGYSVSNNMLKEIILQTLDPKTRAFLSSRILGMCRSEILDLSLETQIELSFESKDNNTEDLLDKFLANSSVSLSREKKIKYINCLYTLNLHSKHIFSKLNIAKDAYDFGYYKTALKILQDTQFFHTEKYDYLMLLGGTQHLLLLPEAPGTFEKASKLDSITVSQKLSAINRQIMSLNQADNKSSKLAKALYVTTIRDYKNEVCDGLVELYRNTNNSFSMDEALEFTIKGYCLATKLNNELEKYKCMHNICMIRLHQNQYAIPLNREELDIEPRFELVDNFFAQNAQYYHKRAYPLLDLGVYEMFQFISSKNKEHLKKAKHLCSKAQLFSKSFYACHIAEMALLVINTHLYNKNLTMIENVRSTRQRLFKQFLSENIVDSRVNRKILLSLAVSAQLTEDIAEAAHYLV